MSKLQPIRGTKDILPDEYRIFETIVRVAKQTAALYGFTPTNTPILESIDVFKRTLGESSDIVGKEMYVFEDRGGDFVALRPEFTAGMVRSFISNGLHHSLPLKLFSYGPVFRRERPQKGRQRQFHQVNFECFGLSDPKIDVELLAMAWHIAEGLGLKDKLTLEINSLGDQESRQKYRDALVEYFGKYQQDLSEDSQRRLTSNPMRILDSKDEGDKKIVADAPAIKAHYTKAAATYFNHVIQGLEQLNLPYTINETLVRGLDYYCHTAFELTTDQLGAQNAVFAGGRYDGLVKQMGGPATPAIGFAGGIERMMALFEQEIQAKAPVVIMPIGEQAEHEALNWAQRLRMEGIYSEILYRGNLGKRMRKAGDMKAQFVLIFGEEELAEDRINVKDFIAGSEEPLPHHKVVSWLKEKIA